MDILMPASASDLPHFQNVDLVIRSKTDRGPLVSAMGKRVPSGALQCGRLIPAGS
jgi:hypothetical protein